MKRRLFLHLGLWKTGTTTIQYFLRENPYFLAEAGVHYPKVGPDNPDHPFFHPRPSSDFLAKEVSHQFLGQELAERKRGAALDLPLWSTAFRLIDGSGAHTAIISYEDFSARVHLYHFDAIAERLKNFDVVGIIYLRPQESWAVSLYSHYVRALRTSLSFRAFTEKIRHRLEYSMLISNIQAQIPLNRIIVRNFLESPDFGLIDDFFSILDLPHPYPQRPLTYEAKNKSLPHWAILFMLRCIQAPFPAERLMEVRNALIWSAARQRPLPLRPGLDLASPTERAGLRALMDADAGRLAEKYGITFHEPARTTAAYRPFDDDDFDAIRETLAPRLATETWIALKDL